jgi:hypothetical protein
VQDIKDAIEAAYGVMPHVTCDGGGALAEVRCGWRRAQAALTACARGWLRVLVLVRRCMLLMPAA